MDAREMQMLVAQIGSVVFDALGLSDRPNYRHYVYATQIEFADAAAVGTNGSGNVQIDAHADFMCTGVRISARIDDTGRVPSIMSADGGGSAAANESGPADSPFLVQFEDGTGDRQWHSRSVDARAVYGDAAPDRGRLARPRRIRAGSTITTTLTLLKVASSGQGIDALVQFIGFKIHTTGT